MNQKNFNELQSYLRFLGFGEQLAGGNALERPVAEDTPEFQLPATTCFDPLTKITAVLYFRWSVQQDQHFLLKYTATLHYPGDPEKDRSQTFYAYENAVFSFKESYNLLQGRYVLKNCINAVGEKYNAWIGLNFKEQDSEGNYTYVRYRETSGSYLERALEFYPIQEMQQEETQDELIRSLKEGNLHPVHFVRHHKTEYKAIEANPKDRTISIYVREEKKLPKVKAKTRRLQIHKEVDS